MEEKYKHHWENGKYNCAKCGHPLFGSEDKFDSTTRWPSFRDTEKDGVEKILDTSHFMVRTEVLCKNCGEHLGHVFRDGEFTGDTDPKASMRYCILSDTLKFKKEGKKAEEKSEEKGKDKTMKEIGKEKGKEKIKQTSKNKS